MTPNAKILISLRDPVEREFSDYLFLKALNIFDSSFSNILERSFKGEIKEDPGIKVEVGLYFENVKRYLDTFGNENVKIVIFEDMIKNPKDQLKEILDFLGVNYDAKNFDVKHANSYESRSKQSKPSIPELEKNLLIDYYKENVQKLEEFLGRKLPWKNFERL